MHVYYATVFDSKNIHYWSGLGYYIGKMLEKEGLTVEYLNDFPIKNKVVHKLKKHFLKNIFNEGYSLNFTDGVSKQYARIIEETVPKGSIIFSPNTVILANLDNSYYKVLFTDATFERLRNFYPAYTNIRPEFVEEAQQIERRALESSDLLIYSSEWAADSAVEYYKADPSKIAVVPFGANIDLKLNEHELSSIIKKRLNRKKLRLLLAGVSWFRKGADCAIEVLNQLNNAGISTELHLVGFRKIPSGIDMTNIVDHGFISKSSHGGQRHFTRLIAESDFLLLPSRADCTPVVVAEANSFGLPCLLSNVGGNHSVVENDINGQIFDFTKGPDACCDYIMSLHNSPEEYTELCVNSYNRYATALNWEISGKKIRSCSRE